MVYKPIMAERPLLIYPDSPRRQHNQADRRLHPFGTRAEAMRAAQSFVRRAFRHTRVIGSLLTVLLISILFIVEARHTSDVSAPRLVTPAKPVFLGTGRPGDLVEGDFVLENRGSAELSISELSASCACSTLLPKAPLTIAPGGEQVISAGIRLTSEGEERNATVRIKSDDPERPLVEMQIGARVPAVAVCSPPEIQFVPARHGIASSRTFELFAPSGGAWLDADGVTVSSNSRFVDVKRLRGDGYRAEVTLSPETPLGTLATSIEFLLDHGGRRLSIPVLAHVQPPILAVPSSLRLDFGDASGIKRVRPLLVKRTDGMPLGTLKRIECPDFLTVTGPEPAGTTDSPCFARFTVSALLTNLAAAPAGHDNSIAIYFTGLKEPIFVAVAVVNATHEKP
jgi:hypothetical protein